MSDNFSKSTGSKTGRVLIWAAVLIGALYMFGAPLTDAIYRLTGYKLTKTEEKRGYYYRLTANFTHKGEPVNFDYVVGCNVRVTSYLDGGRSYDTFVAPKVMMMPTKDGGAVMLRTVQACRGGTTENGGAPEDLFPMAIWFDDVNDMTFGWGYTTEDAYASGFAQLKFHGAKIYSSSYDEWKEWREAAAKDFEPVGMLTTPWGTSYNEEHHGRYATKPYDHSKRDLAQFCNSYSRLKLPDNIRAEIRELWPKDRPRYWKIPLNVDLRELLDKGEFPDGRRYVNYLTGGPLGPDAAYGLPLRDGNGTTLSSMADQYPPEIYPILPRSRSTSASVEAPTDVYPRRILISDGLMKGFTACGGDAPIDKTLSDFDPDFADKAFPILIDDEMAFEHSNPLSRPAIFFDRDEYIFRRGPVGG